MAEVTTAEASEATGATQEATPERATQSAVSREELVDLIREPLVEIVKEQNAAIWATMRSQLTPLQQKVARIDELDGLSSRLEQIAGESKRMSLMVERVFKGTATDEEKAELAQELNAQAIEAEKSKAEKAREIEAKRREAAEAEAQALREAAQKNDGGESVAWVHVVAHVKEAAEDEGLDEATMMRLMPKDRRASQTDPFGFIGMEKAWRKAIREEAKKQETENTPAPVVVTERGGAANTKQSLVNKLAWGEDLSADEMALATKYHRDEGIMPEPNPKRR